MTVSLTEIVFYLSALNPQPPALALLSNNIGHAVQHLYFVVAAPALFIPLSVVLLGSKILPRIFGWTGLALGLIFASLGLSTITTVVLSPAVNAMAAVQSLWWFAAAIWLMARSRAIASIAANLETHPLPQRAA